MTDAIPIIAAVGAAAVPLLTILGYGLGQARWQGRVDQRLESLENRADDSADKRRDLDNKIRDVEETISIRLNSIDGKVTKLIGQLEGKGVIKESSG